MNQTIIIRTAIVIIAGLCIGQTARAVPPPDFIFQVGSQLVGVFTAVFMILSVVLGTFYQFVRNKIIALSQRRMVIAGFVVVVVVISTITTYGYNSFVQKKSYLQWIAQSNQRADDVAVEKKSTTESDVDHRLVDPTDQLSIGRSNMNTGTIPNKNQPFINLIPSQHNDPGASFIVSYYQNIASGNLDAAYDQSPKRVDRETFRQWYAASTGLRLDKLVKIDGLRYSLELTLFEGEMYTRYGVLMTILEKQGRSLQIEKSEVKVLENGLLGKSLPEETETSASHLFFTQHDQAPLSISNIEFRTMTQFQTGSYMILDAREDLEYENGNYPGSTHIRFSDLKAGRWIELPNDKVVYVFCWSGIRGKEVASFLRNKHIVARYLEKGANGWVSDGGAWNGNIAFQKKYSEARFKVVYTTNQVKEQIENGVMLVDCREPWKYDAWKIPGSISLPLMYTPTSDLSRAYAQIPKGSTVITVCDDYVNCFDAKITGVELEHRGVTFLGRYNKPWELKR